MDMDTYELATGAVGPPSLTGFGARDGFRATIRATACLENKNGKRKGLAKHKLRSKIFEIPPFLPFWPFYQL